MFSCNIYLCEMFINTTSKEHIKQKPPFSVLEVYSFNSLIVTGLPNAFMCPNVGLNSNE